MTNNNLLTINVVTYNQEKYIAKCLDSLLSQKTNFGYVIRIFEDCSKDTTGTICQQYAQKYPDKIIYLPNEQNLGATQNALRAYRDISTKYYMYIEGDDYCCNNNKLQMQVDILEKNPQYIFCCHQTLGVNLNNKITSKKSFYFSFLKEGPVSYNDFYTKHIACVNSHISSRIVRTEFIDIPEENPELFTFDSTQILILLEKGDMYFIDKIMTIYQQTGDGLYSSATAIERINHYAKHLLEYNKYSNGKIDKIIYKSIELNINYVLKHIKEMEWPKSKLLAFFRYFRSPFIFDVINLHKKIKRAIIYFANVKLDQRTSIKKDIN